MNEKRKFLTTTEKGILWSRKKKVSNHFFSCYVCVCMLEWCTLIVHHTSLSLSLANMYTHIHTISQHILGKGKSLIYILSDRFYLRLFYPHMHTQTYVLLHKSTNANNFKCF